MYELKKMGRCLPVNLLGRGPRLIKKKNLLGRGLTKVEKHCLRLTLRWDIPIVLYRITKHIGKI